mmetsp:Transcript_14913/g.30729  ORF Transcript_14913/g.30729 Transcript_14913/m.30729 type:complete len:461 (-) Transcript_14913:653-2035(-)|eukprot:CAMPEP_0201134298 /NCGR_PEP_ID=MMETSP0850-20130426/51181_1 /ASSEMBLY_ACC=CAM_ASM_000622 /TAXON_ID=183588 /ORGANISM="Pseudo-nitzschia fraudulenta, Strain WWA7" /LENGTH=460 /DNA_ID=CAMNT_0047405151 /DNA_START=388 /DNA_END=1770 /DNA_ORIENTATION=-
MTKCCNAKMCTECYLQVRPQNEKQSTCPFCNSEDFSVVFAKKKNPCVSGAVSGSETTITTMASLSETSDSSTNSNNGNSRGKSSESVAPKAHPEKTIGFGSELEKDERFKRMKKRSESFASSEGTSTPKKEKEIIESIAMTPEERQRLEEEMKAQHYHPLVLRLEAEAEERRLENDRAYRNNNSNSIHQQTGANPSRRIRGRPVGLTSARNLEQLANFLDSGNDEYNAMLALESALFYNRLSEDDPFERSDEHRSVGTSNAVDNNDNREDQDGFPFLRTLLAGQLENGGTSTTAGRGLLLRPSRRQRNQTTRSNPGSLSIRHRAMGNVALDTANLMMRGISEEEQIAIAIAASMQDQQDAAENNDDDEQADGSDEAVAVATTSETPSNTVNTAIVAAAEGLEPDSVEDSSSTNETVAQTPGQQPEQQDSGNRETKIKELVNVIADPRAPDTDAVPNGIAA